MIKAVFAVKIRFHGKINQFRAYVDSIENKDGGELLRIWLQAINYVFKIYQEIRANCADDENM